MERELTQEEEYYLLEDWWISLCILHFNTFVEGSEYYNFHKERKEYIEEYLAEYYGLDKSIEEDL